MHPMMIEALADEMAMERRSERQRSAIGSLARARCEARTRWLQGLRAVRELGRRFCISSSLRTRVS
jgi:hypothetical protein